MEVIEHYDQPDKFVKGAINRDTIMNKPLGLTAIEKKDLEKYALLSTPPWLNTN